MNYIDYVIAGLLIIGFILGYKDGLVRKIIGLLGIFLGIFLAVKLSSKLGNFIAPIIDHEDYLAEIVAGIVIFVVVIIAASILKRLIHPHDKVSKFTNQILGGITGVLQILFFISGFFLFLNIFNVPNKKTADKSFLYHPVSNIMPKTIDFMIGGKNIFKEYIENKDKKRNDLNENSDKAKAGGEQMKGKNVINEKNAEKMKESKKNMKNEVKSAKMKTKKHNKDV